MGARFCHICQGQFKNISSLRIAELRMRIWGPSWPSNICVEQWCRRGGGINFIGINYHKSRIYCASAIKTDVSLDEHLPARPGFFAVFQANGKGSETWSAWLSSSGINFKAVGVWTSRSQINANCLPQLISPPHARACIFMRFACALFVLETMLFWRNVTSFKPTIVLWFYPIVLAAVIY